MSIIIRLQNLPWSANSVDIRRFFSGLSIPEGGVHIVGGEMGDAFIAFSTDEDARLAMEKNGGTIKDMQIKLLLSSRTEMMRVIEQARQQNMVVPQQHIVVPQPSLLSLQQPPRNMTPTSEPERRRGRSPSPHRRSSRDRSPVRERRRSPDDRRGSKRDRSRSPSRSSRGFSRDSDRRSDRFKRDDRRYDDSRYRDERRSSRESSQESRKYLDADHVNSRSQLHDTEGFRNSQTAYERAINIPASSAYPYGNQPSSTTRNFPETFAHAPTSTPAQVSQAEMMTTPKQADFPGFGNQKFPMSSAYPHEQLQIPEPFKNMIPPKKNEPVSTAEQQAPKPRRRTRFEPEFPQQNPPNFTPDLKPTDNQREASYNAARNTPASYSESRSSWPHELLGRSESTDWNEKQGQSNPLMSKNGDFVQVVPMDLDPSPSDTTPENEAYQESLPIRNSPAFSSNRDDDLRRDALNRDLNDNKGQSMHDRGLFMRGENRGSVGHAENRDSSVHDRGLFLRGESRGPVSHAENRGLQVQDRKLFLHDDNRGPPASHVENRGLPVHQREPVIRSENRGPPMHDNVPVSHAESRESPMHNRGPASHAESRESTMHNRGPASRSETRGPPMHDRRQQIHDENRGPLMHDRGSPSRGESRGPLPLMHDRGSPSRGESRGPSVHDRRSLSHDGNRGPPMHDRRPAPHSESRESPVHDRAPVSHDQSREPLIRGGSQGHIPPSLTVEVRGLPPDARIDDILDIFSGIPLPAANIRIEASDRGFEKAIIRFVSAADFEEALNRNRRLMHEGRCELVPCPASAFESMSRPLKPKPKLKPRDEDLVVQLRGLPFSCKDDDVVRFFDGLGILDLYVEIAPNGKASGIGFVEFGSHDDFRAALAMNGKMIGHRYITVSVASKEMMSFARGEDYNSEAHSGPSDPNPHIPIGNHPSHPPVNQNRPQPNQIRPGGPPANQARQAPPHSMQGRPPPCISLKNLPESVTNRDIAEFLGQMGIMPRAVHIMLRPDKIPSGDGFAEFGGPADMEKALQLSGKPMKGNRILVQPIAFHEMSDILGRPATMPPPSASNALLRTPTDIERPRRPLLPQVPGEGPPFRERPPRMEPPNRGGRPRMEPYQNRMELARPFGPGRMRGPWPNRMFNGGSRPEGRFPNPPAERGLKDFGSPGCVVSINNLHFKAGLEELLDFFRDYNLTKDSVIRKYNENGQTTGEARVAFQNPRDAQKAVRELNQKTIMGRSLSLSLL